MYEILRVEQLVPQIKLFEVYAPEITKKSRTRTIYHNYYK